jgi:hypothetical protein
MLEHALVLGAGPGAVGVRRGRPVALADHYVGPDRQALGREDQVHVLLVHADGAGQHAGSDIAHARHLQQPLDGAVLAVRAVQDRQDDVDLAEQVRYLRGRAGYRARGGQHVELARVGPVLAACVLAAGPRHHLRAGHGHRLDRGQLAVGDGHPARFIGHLHPVPVGGDADGNDLVLRPVDRGQHVAAAHDRHRVLGPAAAEDHRDPDLALLAHQTSIPVTGHIARAWRTGTPA